MNRKTSRLIVAAITIMVGVLITSCADATGWYPSGTATVAGSYEFDEAGVRSLIVNVTIENTGTSAISRSTFTISATTGARTYWKTVTSETRVLPGAKIKVESALAYADAVETLNSGGLTVGDEFFE
ncbi:hypothetical protein MASR2M48_18530 [Spirochaetota bacterium]